MAQLIQIAPGDKAALDEILGRLTKGLSDCTISVSVIQHVCPVEFGNSTVDHIFRGMTVVVTTMPMSQQQAEKIRQIVE